MKSKPILTVDRLKQLLSYDPETGVFMRLTTVGHRLAGSIAGAVRPTGYIQIAVDNRIYLAHRLAWFYVHGRFPEGVIDHINHDRADNRLRNLRDVSVSDNRKNLSHINPKVGSSGHIGVRKCSRTDKWCAYISADGVFHDLGRFDELADAIAARLASEPKYHLPRCGSIAGN